MRATPKSLAIIDCAMETTAHHCFNQMSLAAESKLTFHWVSRLGLQTLKDTGPFDQAYLILGSASHVHQNLLWQIELKNFILERLNEGKPVMGICFGHQLMAQAFGGTVDYIHPDQRKFTGPRRVRILQDYRGYKKDEIFTLGVSHQQEVKTISCELEVLATSDECRYDGLFHRTLPFWSFQAHPELTRPFIEQNMPQLLSHATDLQLVLESGPKVMEPFLQLNSF